MHMIGHEHIGVQGAVAFVQCFAQPMAVRRIVFFTEKTGVAIMAALNDVQRHIG
jgi:hypothetical protein